MALNGCVAALALTSLMLAAPGPTSFTARVVRVIDGDSLEVSTGDSGERVEVRLFGIDCPERGQPYADRARAELTRLVKGRTVRLEVRTRDAYGRTVARAFVGDVDVNLALVREGAAWVYRKYSKDSALLAAEANARDSRRGLWAQDDGEPIPPWEWRNGASTSSSAEVSDAPADPPLTCGAKKYCREMTSCREARFYLEQCGLTRLDGDTDGVPCEQICKEGR